MDKKKWVGGSNKHREVCNDMLIENPLPCSGCIPCVF